MSRKNGGRPNPPETIDLMTLESDTLRSLIMGSFDVLAMRNESSLMEEIQALRTALEENAEDFGIDPWGQIR